MKVKKLIGVLKKYNGETQEAIRLYKNDEWVARTKNFVEKVRIGNLNKTRYMQATYGAEEQKDRRTYVFISEEE